MQLPLLFSEVPFDLPFDRDFFEVEFLAFHPKATVTGVARRLERDEAGAVRREYGVLLVRDRGLVANDPTVTRRVVVARSMGNVTPLPESAGDLVGRFSTDHERWVWLVFQWRGESPPYQQRSPSRPVSSAPARSAAPSRPLLASGTDPRPAAPALSQTVEDDAWPFPA